MSDKDTGGAAFPCAGLSGLPNDTFIHPDAGMTLRDWFASHSPVTTDDVHTLCANRGIQLPKDLAEGFAILAQMNYLYADAMLKERSK